MLAIFLGAGFSKWAADMPLASELFDFNVTYLSEADKKRLRLVESDWANWLSFNDETKVEQFISSCLQSAKRGSRINWYVSRRLSEPFMGWGGGQFAALMIDEKIVKNNEGVIKAKQFLLKLANYNLTGIVTCNYDMLVEFALGTKGFNYGVEGEHLEGRGYNPLFPWQHTPVYASGNLPFAKLHGSLSWSKECKYTSGLPGRKGKALIVPPSPEKRPSNELKDQWELGANILKEARNLIVFGFAFNQYDEALLNFLKDNASSLTNALLIDPSPKEDAKALWPKAKIETLNPLKENYEVLLDSWLSNICI